MDRGVSRRLGASRQVVSIDNNSASNSSLNDSEEPLRDYIEKNINSNLDSMNSHGLNKILGNRSKNKKTENTKLLMEWIKYLEEKVLQLESNFEKYANNTTETNEKESEKLFKLHEELKSDVENKFSNFEDKISSISKAIEEINASLQSTVDQIDQKFSTVENICESMDNDFMGKLANVESKMRSEVNLNNTAVEGSVNKLGADLEIVSGKLNELSGGIETLAVALKSINDEMSQMKSNWQQNEILARKNAQKSNEREKRFEESLDKSTKLQEEKNQNFSASVASVQKKLESEQRRFDTLEKNMSEIKDSLKKVSIKGREQENKMDNALSLVKKDVNNQYRSLSELRISMDNTREISRVERNILQNQAQDLRSRTSVIEGSKGNNNEGIGSKLLGAFTGGLIK